MLLFNLSYRQEKALDGQYTYVLEPNIDDIIKLSGMKQRKQLGYVIKQQLAREITLEKVKLADKYKSKDTTEEVGKPILIIIIIIIIILLSLLLILSLYYYHYY